MSGSSQENGSSNSSPRENGALPLHRDPYGILKVDRAATEDTIQQSYKTLSRTFHPDKQPPGPERDAAQEVFVAFKNAHEILTDPVLRQAYDDHGYDGVQYVKRTLHSADKDSDALYHTLSKLHKAGHVNHARMRLREELQKVQFETQDRAVHVAATLEFPCTTESTTFMGEGSEPLSIPEMKEAHIAFSVTSASPSQDSKWSTTVGGNTNIENGKGDASGQISVEYRPVQGTSVSADLEISNPYKLAVGTTRTLSNRTLVTTTLRTIPNSKNLSLSVVSQRALFENRVRGTWAMAVGTDRSLHYGLLSFTTLYPKYPQCTAKLNIGVDSHPLKLSIRHGFQHSRVGQVSYALGPTGMELKVLLSRTLTSYATWTTGIRHSSESGLTWLLQLDRGDISFRLPITISSVMSPGYNYRVLYLSFFSFLVDEAIGDAVRDTTASLLSESETKVEQESSLMRLDKSKRDAEQQVELMKKTAESCRAREGENPDGLVIRRASYFIDGGEFMDATIQLQFFVNSSQLKLPPTPKSHLLGFYELSGLGAHDARETASSSWWTLFTRRGWKTLKDYFLNSRIKHLTRGGPKLTVRYEFRGSLYEVTIRDTEELKLPDHPEALCLGPSTVVQ